MVRYDATENLRLFIKAGGVGFILGFIHCILGIIFGGKKKNNIMKTAEDIFFAIFACTVTFMFLLESNYGFLRFYILLGEGVGFLLFLLLPERVILETDYFFREKSSRILKNIIHFLNNTLQKIINAVKHKKNKKTNRKKVNKTLAYDNKDDI